MLTFKVCAFYVSFCKRIVYLFQIMTRITLLLLDCLKINQQKIIKFNIIFKNNSKELGKEEAEAGIHKKIKGIYILEINQYYWILYK